MTMKNIKKDEINLADSEIMPLDTRIKSEYDTERVLKPKNDNAEIMPLDTRIKSKGDTERVLKPKNDNLALSSCHSRAMTRESRKTAFRFAESGRISHTIHFGQQYLHPVTLGRSETKTRGSRNEDINSINKDFNSDWMLGSSPSMTEGNNTPNITKGNNTSNITKGNDNICVSIPCHSRAMTRESRSKECRIESGRSMVEMLGTLAIIGVLSIGGIMGYSYGMDKYRANETMQAVTLRGIDVLAQFDRTGDATLNEWQNQKTIYPITLEEGTIGIQVDKVPERVCGMLAKGMNRTATGIKANGSYVVGDHNTCDGDENSLVFYFDEEGMENVPVLEQCGDVVCGQCQKCDKSTKTCVPIVENLENIVDILKTTCISNGYKSFCMGDVCVPFGAPECEGMGDPQCVAYMDGSCQPAFPFPCEKDGKKGACSEKGVCVVSSDPTSCGGVNCIETFQNFFDELGYVDLGLYLPTDCIGCYEGQCLMTPVCRTDEDIYLCWGDSTWGSCYRTCSKNSDCSECEACDNGVCVSAQVNCEINGQAGICGSDKECLPLPEDNTCGGTVCEGDAGCSYCQNNKCYTAGSNVACEKNGKDGYCHAGYCLDRCTSKNDCSANQFCGSPNHSEYDHYIDGIFGVCKDFDFIPITHDGKTYYLSKNEYPWWEAQTMCAQYNNLESVTYDEMISEIIAWNDIILTELGTKILNELNKGFISLSAGFAIGKDYYVSSGVDPLNSPYHIVCR